mgnify:FL=1
MPATLLVLDIDGTLRPHGEPRVPKENVDALRTVQKAGVKLVIATGRCRAEIPAKMLRGIRPDYWICAAGAQVEDAAGTALYTSHMTAEEMYALVDFCEDYEHPLGFSFSDGGYVYLDYEAFHVQEKAAALEGCLKDGEDQDRHLLDMPFSAFGMLAAEDIAKFQAKYGYLGLQFLPYHVTGCDILRAGQDKATGLQALLDHLGLAAADCVAVGDGPNDAGMLALAGRSYCMADGMKTAKAAAKALESELKERVSVIQDQISVLSGQIASVQNSIGQKEQEISAKETEIAEKETEIEEKELEIQDQWSDFKKHMAAMQELRDGGSVAMLSAVNDLYELLTFNEVMQDISVKDTEIMDNMKTAKAGLEADKTALESDRAELVSQKADLQSQKKELDSQNSQMQSKQSELNSSISAARMSAADAKKAQAAAQAAIESDELNYEAVKSQIQKLIAQAASSQPQLSFTGFICPLKSYSRISSEYGWRKNPVSGVNKLHAGIDLAAGGGTPIYAAASGYVQVAGWSSGGYGNYVIIYHGKMSDGNTYSTLYGHMKSVATSAGKYVKQGELIGYVGSTGNSTGNHLHLEVWKGGSKANAVNPRGYIPFPHN